MVYKFYQGRHLMAETIELPVEDSRIFGSFSSKKKEILRVLKKEGEIELKELSEQVKISKMGVLKHIKDLEAEGLIDRVKKNKGVGRPRLFLKLSSSASDILPRAYASMTCFALEYIEENMGRNGVKLALEKRQKEIAKIYKPKLEGKSLDEKVKVLTQIRDSEGYMAEFRELPGKNFELLEYNCPVLAVAEKFGESCTVEREMFEDILDAEVETSHRVVAGDHVCRFFIKPK